MIEFIELMARHFGDEMMNHHETHEYESQAEEITTFIDLSGGNEIDYDELAQVLAQK